tara:strand:+ start:397 stop:594 length:198 start_codon:yes stop_codon:yes gene_type:complete
MKNWITTLLSIVILFFAAATAEGAPVAGLIIALPVIIYWVYRFKKTEKQNATIDAKPDQLLKWNC